MLLCFIDEFYTPAREFRASIWAGMQLKHGSEIHAEYKRIISEVHEDDFLNEVFYAWLAITTMQHRGVGTWQEATQYYEKCLRCKQRRDELYGFRSKEEEPTAMQLVRAILSQMEQEKKRITALSVSEKYEELANMKPDSEDPPPSFMEATKYLCVKCGKTSQDSGAKLMKCARCGVAAYCSNVKKSYVNCYSLLFPSWLYYSFHV